MKFVKIPTRDDSKLLLVQEAFGLKGFAITIKMIQKIIESDSKYVYTSDSLSLFINENAECGATSGLVNEVVNYCVKTGLFDLTDECLSLGKSSKLENINNE